MHFFINFLKIKFNLIYFLFCFPSNFPFSFSSEFFLLKWVWGFLPCSILWVCNGQHTSVRPSVCESTMSVKRAHTRESTSLFLSPDVGGLGEYDHKSDHCFPWLLDLNSKVHFCNIFKRPKFLMYRLDEYWNRLCMLILCKLVIN